jgi:hypothetical protein
MATKKAIRRKAKTSRKAKPRKYTCPNPGKPLGLKAIVYKILHDGAFAKFIRKQLCASHQGKPAATECVESYFCGPSGDELDDLCIPKKDRSRYLCTDHHLLIDAVAVYGGAKKRAKKR